MLVLKMSNIDNRELDLLKSQVVNLVDSATKGLFDVASKINGFHLFRRNSPTVPVFCFFPASIIIVVQGKKKLKSGADEIYYDNTRFLLNSMETSACSAVLTASNDHPCLGFILEIDIQLVTELITAIDVTEKDYNETDKAISLGELTTEILDPFKRLLLLLNDPGSIPVLAPMIIREIHYRILMSGFSSRLRRMALIEKNARRILKSIDWIKVNYKESLRIDALAKMAQMSQPTLYNHYKKILGMSPLQYQKWLRLSEARRLMLNNNIDASTASFQVGYESPSQFSREYKRLFGLSPKKDIEILLSKLGGNGPKRHTPQ